MEPKRIQLKEWWAPVWKGLVFDVKGKHVRQMKSAVWLFLYFLLSADRRTGALKRKLKTIGSDMGISRSTICRWLDILRKNGYVVTRNSGHCLFIQIQRWKPTSGVARFRQLILQRGDTRYPKSETPGNAANSTTPDYCGRKKAVMGESNKNRINRLFRNERQFGVGQSGFADMGVYAKRERLAWDIAKALDDLAGIELYRIYAWKLSEQLLRKVLAESLQIDSSQSLQNKGRSNIFHSLIHKHVSRTAENPRR
jgi:hypothetical protein